MLLFLFTVTEYLFKEYSKITLKVIHLIKVLMNCSLFKNMLNRKSCEFLQSRILAVSCQTYYKAVYIYSFLNISVHDHYYQHCTSRITKDIMRPLYTPEKRFTHENGIRLKAFSYIFLIHFFVCT